MIAIRLLYRLNKFLQRLTAGELGLDMYSMRGALEKAGLKYVD
jgi:hypothetical protein